MEIELFRKQLAPGDDFRQRFNLFSMRYRNPQVITSDCSLTCQDVYQEAEFPLNRGVCVCVHPDSKLRVLEMTCRSQFVSRAKDVSI